LNVWPSKHNLRIGNQPFAGIETDDARIVSNLTFYKNLRNYRSRLFEKRNEKIDPKLINYAAGIAATQIHIGNTKWWTKPGYLENLYKREPEILPFGFLLQSNSPTDAIKTRWQGYSRVFTGYPLVGFPKLEEWSINSWVKGLIESPLYAESAEPWAGSTLQDLKELPFGEFQEFLKSVRDLQIIRPRMFGTLEFRADPAQPNVAAICALAALRLGICLQSERTPSAKGFAMARDDWWQIATGAPAYPLPELLEMAAQGLRMRPYNEERFLTPYFEALGMRTKKTGTE